MILFALCREIVSFFRHYLLTYGIFRAAEGKPGRNRNASRKLSSTIRDARGDRTMRHLCDARKTTIARERGV